MCEGVKKEYLPISLSFFRGSAPYNPVYTALHPPSNRGSGGSAPSTSLYNYPIEASVLF
jgi:hypothetical protein